jgi:hypothetical protein
VIFISGPDDAAPIPFTDITIEHNTGSYICTEYGLLFEGHDCDGIATGGATL